MNDTRDVQEDEISKSTLTSPGSTRVSDCSGEEGQPLSESDSDDEMERFHSNRRLESEKVNETLVPETTNLLGRKIRIRSRPFKLTRNVHRKKIIVSKYFRKDGEESFKTEEGGIRLDFDEEETESYGECRSASDEESPVDNVVVESEDNEPPQMAVGPTNKRRRVVMNWKTDKIVGGKNKLKTLALSDVKKEEDQKRTGGGGGKRSRASAMWQDILKTPSLWKSEPARKYRKVTKVEDQGEDYEEKLMEFVNCEMEHRLTQRGEPLYRRRLREKMNHPDRDHILREFDISPARLEVLFAHLSDEMTAVHRLSEVCRLLQWPPPQYSTTILRPGSVSSSCTIKTATIDPQKPASNTLLANELAASQVLDWLAVVPHDSSQDLFSQTYF